MFIHLGGDTLVSSKRIVALISMEKDNTISSTYDFLKKIEVQGRLEKLDSTDYKSIVITDNKVFLSPISTLTLKKRADFVNNL